MFPVVFFFNDTATTEIYTLSLHDALPILRERQERHIGPRLKGLGRDALASRSSELSGRRWRRDTAVSRRSHSVPNAHGYRSEEHTSELQSRLHLVCRLLLEKKKKSEFADK